jgi:TonB family protein
MILRFPLPDLEVAADREGTEGEMVPGTEAKRKRDSRIVLFLGLSLAVHCLLMVGLYRAEIFQPVSIPDNTVFIDLDKTSLATQTAKPEVEKEKRRQIVETETADQSKPKDADFLSEHNQRVDQQTKARQVDIFRKGGAMSKAGQGGKPQMALKDLVPPSAKPITPPSQAEIDGMRAREKEQLARQEHRAGGVESADNPGSATNDWLKDVKEGDRTLLNTKEFVYFSYFRRIRQRLEVAWNSKLHSTLEGYVYGGRRLANDHDYVTGVVVVLDRNGKITAVRVMQGSGAHDLDDAAVGAFNEAGPFPDPPSGLVDKNGEIQIPWEFHLTS